ncbi:MAG: NUDIX domain-containing protein [Acidilobaceae archaeon]|nr:NUDIX domain-containing protein [Acidilobaceae archaeon]
MEPDSAVLALVWGERVLVVRKSCDLEGYWSCDVALPGGSIERGETPAEAALREAWEEANVPPYAVKVVGDLGVDVTGRGRRRVMIVVGAPRGPIDPRPRSREVDFVGWIPIAAATQEPREVPHPRRGSVPGVLLEGDLVLWGFTLRALRRLAKSMKGL